MAYEMRPGQGSAFPNDSKTNDKAPDFKGRVMLPNGETRWLSAWKKKTAAGQTWISFSIGDLCQGQPASQARANGYQPQRSDPDEDIPF
ncbi:MAG: hypothetical protein EBT15_06975 [Betaproteobacteria bacterium]|nr:hypothetical protein [Betaproteobacteria bacterium]